MIKYELQLKHLTHIQLRTYTDQYFLIFLKSITLYLIGE